jgi:hypothetical protein
MNGKVLRGLKMSAENSKNDKFGNVKLGKVEDVAHLDVLNKALPNARGILIFLIGQSDDKVTTAVYSHGHVTQEDLKHFIGYAIDRIIITQPITVVGIPIDNIEQQQEMS